MSSARAIKNQSDDSAALATMIEINRKAIDEGWEELERLTRLLETLTRDTAKRAPASPPEKVPSAS